MNRREILRYAGKNLLLAVVYMLAAGIGLTLSANESSVALLWPPSGIALVAIILGGLRYWPGVALGLLGSHFYLRSPIPFAVLSSSGSVLEALWGAYLLQRWAEFRPDMNRVRDVLSLVTIGAGLSAIIAATLGVAGLWLANFISASELMLNWLYWWMGDAMGIIVVSPMLFSWWAYRHVRWRGWRLVELMGMITAVFTTSWLAFIQPIGPIETALTLIAFLVFPVLVWGALRFTPREATTASFIVIILAVWGTLAGNSPFVRPVPGRSLLLLWAYMNTTALFAALLAALWQEAEHIRTTHKTLLSEVHQTTTFAPESPVERIENLLKQRRNAQILLVVLLVPLSLLILGLLIQVLTPNLSIWEWRLITIAFVTFGAVLFSYFLLESRDRLYRQVLSELVERRRLLEVQKDLAEHAHRLQAVTRQLQESEERYRTIFEHSPLGILHFDREGILQVCNNRLVEILDSRMDLLIGLNLLQDLQNKEVIQAIKRALAGETVTYEGEYRAVTSGKVTPVRVLFSPVLAEDGHILGGIGIVEDITEQQEARRALHDSEARYRAFIAQNTDGIWRFETGSPVPVDLPEDEQLDLFYEHAYLAECNLAMAQMYGFDEPEAMIGARLGDFLPREDLANEAYLRKFIRSGYRLVDEETREFDIHGNEKFFLNTLVGMVEEGKLVRVWGIQKDVTERRQAQRALQLLQFATDNAPEAMFTVSADGRIIDANETACRRLGYSRDELLQMYIADIDPHYTREVWPAHWEEIRQKGHLVIETENQTKDGRLFPVEVSISYFQYEGRELCCSFIRDITERKRTEEQLRHIQKLESLGVLAGGIAHDFNNLLVAMLGQTSLAQAKLPAHHPAYKNIEKAVQAAEKAAELTRQLLAYSGRGQVELRPVSLNQLVQENIHLLEVAVPKNVRLTYALAESVPFVEVDVAQLQQVIMNLVINGAEAIGDRPGQVTVSTAVQDVTQAMIDNWQHRGEAVKPGQFVVLTVADTGKGMDSNTLNRIFDPFFTTKFTGRGLGLAVVLGIVRAHQGGLEVSSAPGEGTVFRLYFPAITADSVDNGDGMTGETAVSHPDAPSSTGVLLVIDDEKEVRDAIADILAIENIPVLTAPNGKDGIRLYQQHQKDIHLVLLDLSMPDMDGIETFKALHQINPNIPVLISSGYDNTALGHQFIDQKVAGFLPKPYNATTLLQTIRKYWHTTNQQQ